MLSWLRRWRDRIVASGSRRDAIPSDIAERLPLATIDKVAFYKRDEITTDLICCEIQADGKVWLFHEDAEGWDSFVDYLTRLPGFRRDWYQAVVHPAFATSETIAFSKN